MWDADGNRFLDFVQSYGASLLGHAHPPRSAAITDAAAAGHHLRGPDRGRGAPGRGHLRPRARVRPGPPGVVGNRGGHERHPGRPGLYRSQPDREVRRLLPRPFRRPVGRRGQRRGHPRPSRLGRRAGRRGGARRWWPPTTSSPSWTTMWPASSSSRWRPTWGWSPRPPVSSEGLRPACDAAGALLIFDEVITGFRLGRGRGRHGRASDPTCGASAR